MLPADCLSPKKQKVIDEQNRRTRKKLIILIIIASVLLAALIALGIFGYTYGSLLGVFLLGMLTRGRGSDFGNILAMLAGFAVVITLEILGAREMIVKIAFPWRVTIGTLVTFIVGCCFRTPGDNQRQEN